VMTASASYTYSDWKLDVPATPYNDNLQGGGEQNRGPGDGHRQRGSARRTFIDALKQSAPPDPNSTATVLGTAGTATTATTTENHNNGYNNDGEDNEYETKSEVRWE